MSFILNTVRKVWGLVSPSDSNPGDPSPHLADNAVQVVPVRQHLVPGAESGEDEVFEDAVRDLHFDDCSVSTAGPEQGVNTGQTRQRTPVGAGSRAMNSSDYPDTPRCAATGTRYLQRKEKEPAKFNGKSDWGDYKVHFDYVSTWNQWNYQEKGLQSP